MARTVIRNAAVVLPDRVAAGYAVAFEEGKIAAVCPTSDIQDAGAEQVIDAGGRRLAPGFIDVHVHGSGEFLIDDGPDALADLCRLLPRFGVTAFLPTVCPRPKGADAAFLAALARVRSEGADILGFHLEGPFLTLTGALPPEALGGNDPDRVRSLIAAARPVRAVFSVAPDFEGIPELISIMAEGQGAVFMTHTAANVAQTQAAIEAGARHATHFYDVFPLPPVTDPGVRPCGAVEAILADPHVTVDFILDGVHVDPTAVKMALQCKGPDGVCLITDANIGASLPPGRYSFGKEQIEFAYEGGPARGTENSPYPGMLAGSGLTMNLAMRNAIELLGVDLPQAVRMTSSNPARVLGLDHRKGRLAEGFDADLILLDDSLTVTQTWVAGKCRFSN